MKREIKFRGKDIENRQEWRFGSLIEYPDGACVTVCPARRHKQTTPNHKTMKQILSIYLNWRFNIVAFTGLIGFFMACDETDRELLSFFAVKAAAACIMFTAYRLAKYWNAKGYFNDIEEFCKEED